MLRIVERTLLVVAVAGAVATAAAAQRFGVEEKASVELRPDRTAYEAGAAVRVAARVKIEDHWHVNSNTPTYDWLIPTELSLELPVAASAAALTYPPHQMLKFEFTDEPIAVYDGTTTILAELTLGDEVAAGSYEVQGALRYQACDHRQCLPPVTTTAAMTLTVGSGGEAVNGEWFADGTGQAEASGPRGTGTAAPGTASGSLAWMLVLAVFGGFILNAMPCVLPVLSLKVFGLVKSAGEGRSQLLFGTLATTAGILLSFWALALVAVLASRAGAAVGWGVQFQQPAFVAFLAVVVVLFSLNMWGLFEIPLPQSLARVGGSGGRQGLAGHFASGLFATLMATPCSAPFLGTAVGFALGREPAVIFAIFTAVGIGLALPYLLIAALPGMVDRLPKPGPWMVTMRQMMGFLLAAAAVWLFYVLAAQIAAEQLAVVQLALLALAFFAWLHHRSEGRSRRLAAAGMVLASVAGVALAVPGEKGRIDWVVFDESQAIALASGGRPVFVDFTADWCLTCKANERLVLETAAVADAFDRHRVVAMKGDWTNRDDTISEYLGRYGKAAVPFYILYRPGQEPLPFGELLTKGRVLGALDESAEVAAALPVTGGG
ncbi:MAG: thioredoxin family protein [Thermoanaerobaculia bacterium]